MGAFDTSVGKLYANDLFIDTVLMDLARRSFDWLVLWVYRVTSNVRYETYKHNATPVNTYLYGLVTYQFMVYANTSLY